MARYLETGYQYRLSLVEVQKLAYFLQSAGESLRLEYKAHYYGPYADNLRKALRNIEGHYTRGVGDGRNTRRRAWSCCRVRWTKRGCSSLEPMTAWLASSESRL